MYNTCCQTFLIILFPLFLYFCYRRFFKVKKKLEFNFTDKDIPTLANINWDEDYTLYIGRVNRDLDLPESKWQNIHKIKKSSDRIIALQKHEVDLKNNKELLNSLHELAGHTLGCWCYSSKLQKGKLCHGHTLIKLFKEKYIGWIDVKLQEPVYYKPVIVMDSKDIIHKDWSRVSDGETTYYISLKTNLVLTDIIKWKPLEEEING